MLIQTNDLYTPKLDWKSTKIGINPTSNQHISHKISLQPFFKLYIKPKDAKKCDENVRFLCLL